MAASEGSILAALGTVFWFVFKILLFMLFFIWLRATSPRLRYDQLMNFSWKGLVPVALANIMLIATLLTLFYSRPTTAALGARHPALSESGRQLSRGTAADALAERRAFAPERQEQ
jgi:hypothetical protein